MSEKCVTERTLVALLFFVMASVVQRSRGCSVSSRSVSAERRREGDGVREFIRDIEREREIRVCVDEFIETHRRVTRVDVRPEES